MKFYHYPKCTTCIKARKFLIAKYPEMEIIDIKLNPLNYDQIKEYHQKANCELKKIFNTSGLSYKSLNLKEKLGSLSLDEAYKLLASDPMLIKRPVIILDDKVFFGFKEDHFKWLS